MINPEARGDDCIPSRDCPAATSSPEPSIPPGPPASWSSARRPTGWSGDSATTLSHEMTMHPPPMHAGQSRRAGGGAPGPALAWPRPPVRGRTGTPAAGGGRDPEREHSISPPHWNSSLPQEVPCRTMRRPSRTHGQCASPLTCGAVAVRSLEPHAVKGSHHRNATRFLPTGAMFPAPNGNSRRTTPQRASPKIRGR